MTKPASEHDAATAILSALGTMAIVVDSRSIVTATEPLATELGYDTEELIGEPPSTILRSADDDTELLAADGHSLPVRVRRQPLSTGRDDREWTGLFITAINDSDLTVDEPPTNGVVGDRSRGDDPASTASSNDIGVDAASDTASTVDLADMPFEALFEAVNDAIFLVDTADSRITWANSRACELLGYSREQLLSLEPKAIHPHEYDAFRSFVEEVHDTGEGWTTSLSCYTCDGEVIPAEISGTRVTVGGSQQLLASVRDISTRVDQREQLGRLAAAMKAATDGVAIYTADGEIVYANHSYAELFGVDSPGAVTDRTWGELHEHQERFSLGIASSLAANGEWRGEVTAVGPAVDGSDAAESTDEAEANRPLAVSLTQLETGEVLCVAHDISAQRAHERRLTGLATASRKLLAAADCEAVGRVAVETVVDVLDLDYACIRRYDEPENELSIATISAAAERLQAEQVADDLNSSRAGAAYRRGETVRNEPSDDAYSERSRADCHVPVGEYGVLTVVEPDGSFSDQRVHLLELFAESVRAAFIRADRETQLRDRQTELEARTDELTVASKFNALVTELIELMLRTAHRGEIERAVCERLVDSPLYDAAWIAGLDDETVTVSTRRVDTGAFTETEPDSVVSSPFAEHLVRAAAETGAPEISRRQFDSRERADDRAESDETLATAVPIAVGSRQFGVLAVASTDNQGFSETIRSGLGLVGETLGFAFVLEATRSTLTANDAIELEFAVTERFAELSAALDCQCLYAGSSTTDAGERLYRIRIRDADCQAVISLLESKPSVTECQLLTDHDNGCLLGVIVDDPAPEILADTGVNLRSLVAENGESRLVIEAPEDIDIGELRSRLADYYGSVKLVSKQHGRRARSVDAVDNAVAERLTDKQLTVLETATELGYYDWPREATAEKVAETLGIASSTLHQHLRAAEGKLVAAFFEGRQ